MANLEKLGRSIQKKQKKSDYWKNYLAELQNRTAQIDNSNIGNDIAPVREDKWVQGSNYFEDGYQFGDIYRTIDASAKDLEVNVMSGILGLGEKAVDLGATIVGGIGGLFNKGFGEDVKNFVAKDLYDADAIARGIVGVRSVDAWFDPSVMNEENSVMGEKMDSLAQSGGEMIGALAAGPYGNYVIGMNAFSGEVENAFQNGASYGEAIFSGAVSAAAEMLTEKISGGIKFGKAGTLDDGLTRKLVTGISNNAIRGLAKLGLDVVGEGAEEVLSEYMGAIGRKLSYESEKNVLELLDEPRKLASFMGDVLKETSLFNKEAWKESYADAFLGGAILGGVGDAGKFVDSKVGSKRDMTSGLTADEEKVFLQEYNESLAEKQKDGTKLTGSQKNALYKSTMKRLEEGDINTDKIESILGGDEYKAVQEAKDEATRKAAQTKLTQSMYERVRDTKLGESYREKARASQKLDMDLSQYNEAERKIVKKAMDEGKLNNTRKTRYMVDFVSRLAAAKGVDFDFTDDAKLSEMGYSVAGAKVNGYYDSKTKTIGVNVESSKYLNTVVGHEITHVLEGTELYGKLQDAIFKYAQSKNDFDGRKEALKKFYKESDIDAELTADLVGEYLFTDSEFINRLYGTNRNVFQKIYDEIKYMLKLATAGSREARELEKVKHAFEKAFKSTEKSSAVGETKNSLGYHAGDLGKAEGYHIQGKSRDTGHFGTGTYFVGDEMKINDSYYGKRPHHAVEFDNYNLYKIQNDKEGYKLHDNLRVLDGGFTQEFLDAAMEDKYRVSDLRHEASVLTDKYDTEEYDSDLGMKVSSDFIGASIRAMTEVATENGVDVLDYDAWLSEQGGDVPQQGDSDYDYYKRDYLDYLKDELNKADEARNEGYEAFRDAYFDLWLKFGKNKVNNALQQVLEHHNKMQEGGRDVQYGADSNATVFMKALGYEGIDARGTGLDNVGYGSVIYDLKGEDLDRKNAIGTAKYSLTGINADGIEVYETSAATLKLSWDERIAQYLDIMKNEYNGRTAKFVRNGHVYYAKFDQRSIRKPIYGDKRSRGYGKQALIKAGADGDLFDLVENSAYTGGKPNIKDHTNADYFDYFVKTVQIDGRVFDLIADVEKTYGGDGGYVYTLALRDNKTIKASPATGTSQSEPFHSAGNASYAPIIPQDTEMSSGSAKKSLSDANLAQEQKTAFEEAKIVPPTDSIHYNLDAVESHREKLNKQFTVNPSASVVSLKDLFDRYDKIVDIWERLGGELNSKFLDEWNAKKGKDRTFTVFKAQAGYKYNIELSSMCKKGVPLFEAIDTIVKKEVLKELDTDTLGKAEKEILYDILKQHDFEIPCAICYVEQARQREGVIINDFLNGKEETGKLGWNQVLMQVSEEMAKNGVNYTFAKVDRSIASDGYNPTDVVMDEKTQEAFYSALQKLANDEIVRYNVETREKKLKRAIRSTLKGTTPADVKACFKGTLPANLKIFKVLFQESSSRVMLDADLPYSSMTTQNLARSHHGLYSLFNSQGGVSGYKTKQGTVVYWGDILDKKWEASKLRGEGGVRYQSNSDSQMYTLLDQAQMYMDFTAKGYYLQAYTKVLSQLKLFGLSRGKINASLIPAVKIFRDANGDIDVEKTMEYAGLDENGELLFDDLEGINHEEAFMLISDPEYSKNVGGVCIGYSDKHIDKLLDDPRVQLIIGFHDKTNDTNKRYAGAKYAKNYNGLNEAVNSDGETEHIAFNKYVQKAEKLFAFDSKTETYSGSVNFNGKSYTANDIPRLAADLYLADCAKKGYTPAYQMFEGHQNYYKLLADFSLYDSNGQYAPHKKVAYDMPDQVPYLDENGEKQYMDTEKYIKQELTKEMQVRDSISEAMADTSEEGIIPQFIKRVNELHAQKSLSAEGSTQTRRGDLNITGEDVRLHAPTADIAPVKATAPTRVNDGSVKFSVSAEEPTDTDEEIAPIAPVEEPTTPATDSTADTEEEKIAKVLTEEQNTENGQNLMSMIKNNFLDKGMVFEDLSLQTGNRELQAKWNSIRYAEGKAQKLIGEGNEKVSSLTSIREKVEKSGKTEQFYEYLYHKHNVDRMSLESAVSPTIEALKDKFKGLRKSQIKGIASRKITDATTDEQAQLIRDAKEYLAALDVKNKPVFGDSVTSDVSKEKAAEMERENPEFKETAKEVYDYMNYLRSELVKAGVITEETAKLWEKMYPHYVPIRRVGKDGASINVPLATNRTGINAPIKAAKGGNSAILPLFNTMALRTEQTYKAIAKNRFGVELKNTLNTEVADEIESVDDAIDSIDNDEALLQEGKNGASPTLTVFENGKRVTFEITEEMYDAIKPTSKGLSYTNKVVSGMSNFFRGVLTEYNPVFMVTNAVKDAQDILMNSQHARKTYAAIPKAIAEIATKGKWYQEYIENGGERNTYFDGNKKAFKAEDNAFKKIVGMPLRAISFLNNTIEQIPRLAEYIASREAGASVDVAMLDSARVTTNFAAGGDVTKLFNRNGFYFLNASTQGALQQVRNVREAKANGLKGWVSLATKVALAGVPVVILNALIWDDDEEYDDLSDYVKQNYYIVAKMGDGTFVRIPKGRALAVIQDALQQVANGITGNDEVDLNSFLELAINNLAPNNPLENNLIAPIVQVANNKTWYGDDLVPTRLQDLPNAEQYDESTDAISKWLGSVTNQSPYKINYLLDQYTGGVGDMILPMLTPEAESGDNSIVGNLIAPWRDKFTADSVMNNQNVTDFYEIRDKATVNANSMYATDEDTLKSKYMNSASSEMLKLYQMKREIQNSNLSDAEKYNAVREIQKEIDAIAKAALSAYENAQVVGDSAIIGNSLYEREDGQWKKANDGKVDIQDIVADRLSPNASAYWKQKSEADFAAKNPTKYAIAQSAGGYEAYKKATSDLSSIKADMDANGNTISGSRKKKVMEYISNLDIDYEEKLILYKSEYKSDNRYNVAIVNYLNNNPNISYEQMMMILAELGFNVTADGRVTW